MGLENKAAFVSGAGRNIGRAIALELAGHGCNVIVNGLTGRDACEETASAVRAKGVKAVVCVGDIGDSTAVKAMAAQAFAAFGIVDIVVNNAAIRPHQPFLEMSEADYHRVLAIDLHAAVYTSRAFLPGMIGRKCHDFKCTTAKMPRLVFTERMFGCIKTHNCLAIKAGTGMR